MGICGSSSAPAPAGVTNPVSGGVDEIPPDKRRSTPNGEYVYNIEEHLGEGQYATVYKATQVKTGKKVALKVIEKYQVGKDGRPHRRLTDEDIEGVQLEVNAMRKLKHEGLVSLFDFEEDENRYYMSLELVVGGELFDRIASKQSYSEADAARAMARLVAALEHMHQAGVVHRDLKPENILLVSKDTDDEVKIADFGFAKECPYDAAVLMTALGTPGYVAPEVIVAGKTKGREKYGHEADIWSMGVILYIMLCGYPPFHAAEEREIYRQILAGDYYFHDEFWTSISDEAKDLVRRMLTVDPKKRITAKEILDHPWIRGAAPDVAIAEENVRALRRFNAKRKMRGAIQAVRGTLRLRIMLRNMRQAAAEKAEAEKAGAGEGEGGAAEGGGGEGGEGGGGGEGAEEGGEGGVGESDDTPKVAAAE